MGTRTRLFASAAFPLLSLSLMLQPAQAALLQGSGINSNAKPAASAATFEVAQAAEPAQDEQDPRKKKKPQGEEEGQPPKKEPEQKHEKPAEAPKQPAAESEAPKPPKAAEPEAAPKPPKAAQQEAPKAAEPEAVQPPKHNKPTADAAEPEAPKPPKAVQPEAPKPPKAAQPEAPAAAEPEAQPQGNKHHKPNGQAQPETAPAAEQPSAPAAAQPEATPAQPPKKHQKPANGTEQPQAEPLSPAVPAEAPAKPPKPAAPNAEAPAQPAAPSAEAPVAPKAEGAKPPVKPEGEQKPGANGQKPAVSGEQPAPATPGEKPAPAAPGEKLVPAAPGEKPAPAAPGQPPATPGEKPAPGTPPQAPAPANGKPAPAAAPAAPAQNGAVAPQAAPSTAGEQVSPAELEKRKKIADNPTAAGSGAGPVILPVQNGTAVLDSDKDSARHGHHGQPGEGQPVTGGQAPVGQAPGQPAPGQVRQDQRPPAPENVRAPTSDADSQRVPGGNQAPPVRIQAVTSEQGRRMDQRPDFAAPDGAQIEDRQNNRVIINFGDDTFVRHDDTQRFTRDGERPTYEQLPRDRYRETIDRPDGTRIVTVRNRYGDIIQRSRIDGGGREYVLFYSPELENQPNQDDYYRDPGDELPPMRLRIPLNQYIIDTSEDQNQDYYDFLRKPPVEPVERVYSLNEVRYSARIRDKVRRIDLDTITFATGSADIPMVQAKTIRGIAEAIGNIIKKDPSETFLIEGHTDAVGSDQSNLILSDQRAESVANVLTDVYGIPPENLATQGYGEQYLKINTDGPEQENRRVTIRRVTALVRPVASK